MKKLIPSLLFILFNYSSNAQDAAKNDLKKMDLHGPVKSMHVTYYKAVKESGGVVKGEKIMNFGSKETKTTFNEKGYKTEEITYNQYGNQTGRVVYYYDDKGNVSSQDSYQGDGSMLPKSTYAYKYDASGKIIERDDIDTTGFMMGKVTYEYNGNGKRIGESFFNSDGTLAYKRASIYNSNGAVIEVTIIDSTGNETMRILFKWDDYNQLTEQRIYKNGKDFESKNTYIYDSIGFTTEVNTLNEKGKVTEKRTYKYIIDDRTNVVQTKEFKNGKPELITEQVIEYY